ncbi:MAG TPA: hypothetical protein VFD89_01615 [Clostridia bacterium]|nr:hypothetical protein [Clostridia bacterium]
MSGLTDYEVLINKIPGVISSRFVANQGGEIIELHVLADIYRSPKQLVRDIQSAMLTTYNLKIDHKIISIAQIEDDLIGPREHRFNLHYVKVLSEGPKSQVEVILLKDGESFLGMAQGGNSLGSRIRLISEAALNAIQNALDIEYVFILGDITPVYVSDKKAYMVTVSHLFELGEELLCGCCIVTKDESETVVKATLDAINRRIVRYFK